MDYQRIHFNPETHQQISKDIKTQVGFKAVSSQEVPKSELAILFFSDIKQMQLFVRSAGCSEGEWNTTRVPLELCY